MTNQERELLASTARSLLFLQERVDALEKQKGQPSGYLDKIIAKARRD